jgi:hypothetical protein
VLILKEMAVWGNVALVAPVEPGSVPVWNTWLSGWGRQRRVAGPRGWRGGLRKWRVVSGEWRARRSRSLVSLPDKVRTGGMTICWGLDGLGWGRLGGLWNLSRTGLPAGLGQVPTGHHTLDEFSARGRQGSVR